MSEMTDETDVYVCGICKKEFQDFVAFLQHKSTFGVFKCKLCNLSYHDREDIQKHINENHANQKVDVAFTIPNKTSIVSTKTQPENKNDDDAAKSPHAVSVFTCRLCNRFTLVERSMLQHLESMHKIHVVPRSVELAALMLCSKPLDSTVLPRLTGNPITVKTVTAPTAIKPPVIVQSAGTQTVLCTANIEMTLAEVDSSPDKGPEFYSNWALFAEALGPTEGTISMADDLAVASADNAATLECENDNSVAKGKMESILKTSILDNAKCSENVAAAEEILGVAASRESNVCIDGGHDYVSISETRESESLEMIVGEQQECVESTAAIVLATDVEEFSSSYVEPSTQVEDAPISYVEQIITQDDPSVIVTPEPEKMTITTSPSKKTNEGKAAKDGLPTTLPPAKESHRLVSGKSKVVIKLEVNDEEDREEEPFDDESDEEAAEPQPGADGMYHCRKCNRAFMRERQFKAHMNVHVMYGEHVMESPSSSRAMNSDAKVAQRKRQKTH